MPEEPQAPPSRYRILAPLGRGGMGEVFRAHDTLLGRDVALKWLRPDRANDAPALARLLAEARASAALQHPNVVTIYDVGEHEGRAFIAMELLEGASLRQVIDGRGATEAQKLAWLLDVARALDAAHRAGIVHRDVKPENVVVCSDGFVRLIDFGIAKPAPVDLTESAPTLSGTPRYMSPEQRLGHATQLSDQFAWGTVAFELLTGVHPADAPAGQDLYDLAPGLPTVWIGAVTQARASRADDRFPTMAALLSALGDDRGSQTLVAERPAADMTSPSNESIPGVSLSRGTLDGLGDLGHAPPPRSGAAPTSGLLRATGLPRSAAPRSATPPSRPAAVELGPGVTQYAEGSPASKRRDDMPEPGDVLEERYRIVELLGQGAMGAVYSAEHIQLRRRVAIKFLRDMSTQTVGRFAREARVAARLTSPYAIRVIDVATPPDARPYLVMELLTGDDLETLVAKGGPLPLEEAVRYVLEACDAVAEAHAMGVVHRDLKPGNLFLTNVTETTRSVRVLDFGLSKVTGGGALGETSELSHTNMVMGSPAYMSPEQIRSAKNVDVRTDVWSLAVVLYELLTGELPFPGTSPAATFVSITTRSHVPVTDRRPELPLALDAFFDRCFVKDPAGRIPTVAALAEALIPFASPDDRELALSVGKARPGPLPTPPPKKKAKAKKSGALPTDPGRKKNKKSAKRAIPIPKIALPRAPVALLAAAGALTLILIAVLIGVSRDVVPPAESAKAGASGAVAPATTQAPAVAIPPAPVATPTQPPVAPTTTTPPVAPPPVAVTATATTPSAPAPTAPAPREGKGRRPGGASPGGTTRPGGKIRLPSQSME